ncbi:hypothetical protein EHQ58_16055 [Leptospira ognonensis]|uniref:Uncharacterized protein n=1 Tax=Leptospira ognonensis TaxID=2484945 RepID=A0A4R9JYL9_9LEPT|nr:hypothetical protein [Leptospira ognonensis]TGL56708.1 hypothetical protein EHQ58_16055 [Leptospira ognonensis]
MPTSKLVLALEKRLRALGNDDPIYIADIIRKILSEDKELTLTEAMDRFETEVERSSLAELGLEQDRFPDLKFESLVLKEFRNHPDFNQIAVTLKNQFSSRGKGFGKMVPRPIDFSGFARLSEEKIDKKTVIFTILFWIIIYSLILYFI